MYSDFVELVKSIYGADKLIPLHEPTFMGNEEDYLHQVIKSTFVSTNSGVFIDKFEKSIAEFTGSKYAISTVNGTAALHIALLIAGVQKEDEVITQSLTFIATCNAISYCNAQPIFLDVSKKTLGLSSRSLHEFLEQNGEIRNDGFTWNKISNKRIKACIPMNTFGHPAELMEINEICKKYNILVIEDAAESLGSYLSSDHTATTSELGILSFNGNKIITTGGGGMILTQNREYAALAKHLTTTAKLDHSWNFDHDQIGYNYRMPNINAALGLAQIESLPYFLKKKRDLANSYKKWCDSKPLNYFSEPKNCHSNYWLNTLIMEDEAEKESFLEYTNKHNVQTRPVWTNMHKTKMFQHCFSRNLENTIWLSKRIINIPSSIPRDEK